MLTNLSLIQIPFTRGTFSGNSASSPSASGKAKLAPWAVQNNEGSKARSATSVCGSFPFFAGEVESTCAQQRTQRYTQRVVELGVRRSVRVEQVCSVPVGHETAYGSQCGNRDKQQSPFASLLHVTSWSRKRGPDDYSLRLVVANVISLGLAQIKETNAPLLLPDLATVV